MPTDSDARAQALFRRGRDLRAAQRIDEAVDAIAAAAAAAPDDPALALANARIHFEAWRPAAALADRAAALAPGDLSATSMLATALEAEGQGHAADALLVRTLASQPAWTAGHLQLVRLRATSGVTAGVDGSLAAACAALPDHAPLRLAWFHALVGLRDWRRARTVVADGVGLLGPLRSLTVARIFLASESDEASRDPHLFDPVADLQDVGLDVARTRFLLRTGRPGDAAAIAGRHVTTASARTFWPYLSLAWRLLGDPRADWLDRDRRFVATHDLGLSAAERELLAATLRSLLRMAAPYPEQSVRGGVQTDRQLFFHPDPAIQHVRRRLSAIVRDYLAALPAAEPDHPLLSMPRSRDPILFEGSWCVLLRPEGHHAAHTHSRGWISSALHLELPEPEPGGGQGDRAGWIAFGTPPAELGLDLPPTEARQPRPGSVILFPSTTWHRTMPFARGERLTIAFDVAPPC